MQPTDVISARTYSQEDLELIDAYWRAANYLSVGQIYLLDNPSHDEADCDGGRREHQAF